VVPDVDQYLMDGLHEAAAESIDK